MFVFREIGVLCFLLTAILRFALLSYCRRPMKTLQVLSLNSNIINWKRKTLKGGMYFFFLNNASLQCSYFPTDIYLFKFNNGNFTTTCEICSKLTINAPERRQWDVVLVSLLLSYNKFHKLFGVSATLN